MELLEIIKKELIIVPLTSSTKEGVVKDLVKKYADCKGRGEAFEKEVYEAVMAREALGSTAMEKGIAIPHCKLDDIDEIGLVIGVSRLPIDFGGEEKSKIFFLMLAPAGQPAAHIQVLSSIAKVCSSDVFVRMLSSAKTPVEVYRLFFDKIYRTTYKFAAAENDVIFQEKR